MIPSRFPSRLRLPPHTRIPTDPQRTPFTQPNSPHRTAPSARRAPHRLQFCQACVKQSRGHRCCTCYSVSPVPRGCAFRFSTYCADAAQITTTTTTTTKTTTTTTSTIYQKQQQHWRITISSSAHASMSSTSSQQQKQKQKRVKASSSCRFRATVSWHY